jgi:hypothetical protein
MSDIDQSTYQWHPFIDGESIGKLGTEEGMIVKDEEYDGGARITLEREGETAPFAITCGVYGWMVHTCFFGVEEAATGAYDAMKTDLGRIVDILPDEKSFERIKPTVIRAIDEFVVRFP